MTIHVHGGGRDAMTTPYNCNSTPIFNTLGMTKNDSFDSGTLALEHLMTSMLKINPFKDVRAKNFYNTDFFHTLAAVR